MGKRLPTQYLIPLATANIVTMTTMFDSYMESHQVSGFSNTPIIINGDGYRQFMHLIARSKHQSIVDVIKDDVLEGWGK